MSNVEPLPLAPPSRDVASHRLTPEQYLENFADMHPPLSAAAARIEAERCYTCYDAPCTEACPTDIDVPGFIRRIASGNLDGAAALILEQNVLGGTCARVCPTEELCERACVRNAQDDRPVTIALLQRYAVDHVVERGTPMFERAPETGRTVAVVGAGPAGLACAHGLARRGHRVVVFDARPRAGGLNEYGLAAYKMGGDQAQRELAWLLEIGGIELRHGQRLGAEVQLGQLQQAFDAVFLAVGLGAGNRLGVDGEEADGVLDALGYIAELRQRPELAEQPVGRRVVVIGGGMTAIDIAAQTRLLGAEEVTIVYRRAQAAMPASRLEQDFAVTHGVRLLTSAWPRRLLVAGGEVRGVEFERTCVDANGALRGTGELFELEADQVFRAIGQSLVADGIEAALLDGGRLAVDAERRTRLAGVWAGGDCVAGSRALTVTAVQDGKLAAQSIDDYLRADAR